MECKCELSFASDTEAEYEWCKNKELCPCNGTKCQWHIERDNYE